MLVFWNPRGISNKEVALKAFLQRRGASYAGISESQTYRSGLELSDKKWRWEAGVEGKPSELGRGPSRGMGAFIDTSNVESSLVRTGKYTAWHRIEAEGNEGALVVGVGYFPEAQDTAAHATANEELREALAYFHAQGARVLFGGDLNAHTGANGDKTPLDAAGRMILNTVEDMDMVLLNTAPGICVGGPSRVQVRVDGTQESTIDYIMCSSQLLPYIQRMEIEEGQMGSDHRPLVLYLKDLVVKAPQVPGPREVWDVRNIPSPPEDWSWVTACQTEFEAWIAKTGSVVSAATAAGADAARVADVLEWSFQHSLDRMAAEHLGTRTVGPRVTPIMDAAARLAAQQHEVSRSVMRRIQEDADAPPEAKETARKQYMAAGRRVVAVAARRKQLEELALFRDIESKQGNSKLFWSKFKQMRNTIRVNKSPPSVATDEHGDTITDPVGVLRAWRDFSARIASADLEGTDEEGIYDEEYKKEVEARLRRLRNIRAHQPELDRPITAAEIFRAIRKLKMGKAPGQDGILTDILKTAADAVNNSKLRGNNTVVEALVLLFNYVFDNEVWPERWGTGVIVPLHKHDSRLDPSNYRPITLLSVVGKLFGIVVNDRLSRFSEMSGTMVDEQGGFRPRRGTPDQVFILREVLASRKERDLPTYATYIDVRKAYDTVWREDAYTRIFDSGVQGKLWRQLQAMHSGLSRRVLHPLGLTEWFDVERGVAQGAVESPWVYANFIDGLARELKRQGFGIMIAGRRLPILLYADDMILLASSQRELAEMNAVASEYARKHRFQFNGAKSAVMAFNVSSAARRRAYAKDWRLFGEVVRVTDSYEYLGTFTPSDGISWGAHVRGAIAKAKRRSADLLWVCRSDRGVRPRTAVTLWQALVRPLLEYASELWSGQVTATLTREAEAVQTRFLRGVLGLHRNGSGVSNDILRAEVGCERICDRWSKLTLGYWRRVFTAPADRLLRVVAEARHAERARSGGVGYGKLGWMPAAERALQAAGLYDYWVDTSAIRATTVNGWRERVYDAVNADSDASRHGRMAGMLSAQRYVHLKEWGVNTEPYSFSSGEEGRLGQHVPERYLDDRECIKGTRIKMLCRLDCLPLMDRVGREVVPKWPKSSRVCFACGEGVVEDTHHFLMVCPAYAEKRSTLLERAARILDGAGFEAMDPVEQGQVLLGKRIGDPGAEDSVDRLAKRFLVKAWNTRKNVMDSINMVLGTSYDVYVSKAA